MCAQGCLALSRNFRVCNLAFVQARLPLSDRPEANVEVTLCFEDPYRRLPEKSNLHEDFCRLRGCDLR